VAINVTWLQNGGYTAQQDRTEQTAILTKSAVTSVRPGIIPSDGTDATVTAQGTPNMTVNISPFQAVVPDASGRAYLYTSDSTVVSPTFTTASPSNPRIDLVIARVYDNAAGDSASTTSMALPGSAGSITVQSVTGTVEVVTGTPAGSPTAPALPNSRCIILAVVTVGTSVTSITTGAIGTSGGGASRAAFTVASGGLLPCASSATYPATPYEGMEIYDQALNYKLVWDATKWEPENTSAAWTSYTPTLVNITLGNGTLTGRFCQVGKTLHLRVEVLWGSTTSASGAVTISLPSGMTTTSAVSEQFISSYFAGAAVNSGLALITASGSTLTVFNPATSASSSFSQFNTASFGMPAGSRMQVAGTLELA
jgi:hypothetical protein